MLSIPEKGDGVLSQTSPHVVFCNHQKNLLMALRPG